MIDLIALVVTLIIMSLFGIGIMLALIIMSQPTTELEQAYEDEEQIKTIIFQLYLNKIIENICYIMNDINDSISFSLKTDYLKHCCCKAPV